jgi:hypothetical protein
MNRVLTLKYKDIIIDGSDDVNIAALTTELIRKFNGNCSAVRFEGIGYLSRHRVVRTVMVKTLLTV